MPIRRGQWPTRRRAHRCLGSLGSIATALILITGFGLWRLMQGPIELDRLTPYVEEALNRSTDEVQVTLSGVRLAIDPSDHRLDLQLEGVRLSRSDGELLAAFSEMSASFSLSALLRGNLMPSQLVVEHPVLHFTRDRQGKIGSCLGNQIASESILGPELLKQAVGAPASPVSFGLMRRIVVRNAKLSLDDEQTGRHWQADRVDATVERDTDGLTGDLSIALAVGAGTPQFRARYRYLFSGETLDLAMEVGAVEPRVLAGLIPELAPLAAVNFPVSGTLETRLDLARLATEGARLDLGLGPGSFKSELLAGVSSRCAAASCMPSMLPKSVSCDWPNSPSISAAARFSLSKAASTTSLRD